MKGKKLEDVKTLDGKGRLTDKATDKMQTQFGNETRANNLIKWQNKLGQFGFTEPLQRMT